MLQVSPLSCVLSRFLPTPNLRGVHQQKTHPPPTESNADGVTRQPGETEKEFKRRRARFYSRRRVERFSTDVSTLQKEALSLKMKQAELRVEQRRLESPALSSSVDCRTSSGRECDKNLLTIDTAAARKHTFWLRMIAKRKKEGILVLAE